MSKILGNVEELNSVVNVAKYGAVGDGVTDDTAAIQAALSSTSKIIEFTSGKTYLVDGGLTTSVTNRTIIATGATIKLKNSATNYRILIITGANTTVTGGTWDGNRDNQSVGTAFQSYSMIFNGTVYGLLENAIIQNWRGTGAYAANSSYITVNNCTFLSIGNGDETSYGVYMEATAADKFGCEVTNSRFLMSDSGIKGQPILFTSTILSGGFGMYDWEISGNHIEGSTSASNADQAICMAVRGARGRVINNYTTGGSMGWSEGGDDTIISNNTIMSTIGTVRWGIEPSGSRMVISDNFVRNHGRCITGTFTNDDLTITGNYCETDNTYTSISLGGPVAISFVPATSKTAYRVNIASNTLRSKNPIKAGKDCKDWNIVGNDLIGPGSATASSRGIFTDTITSTSLIFNIIGNKFNGFERAMGIYSLAAVTYTDISFNDNNCQNDVAGGSTSLIGVEGSAVLGARIMQWGNPISVSGSNLKYFYDRSNLRGIELSDAYATPESNVAAGIGSQYLNIAGSGGTSLWVKESGTSNTGWTRIGSTQQFANGTVSAPSVQSKAFSSTGIYFPSTNTIGFTANGTQVGTYTDSNITFNLNNLRIVQAKTPSGPTDTGAAGTICWDTNYLYICVNTNAWTRIGLTW